MYRNTNYFVLSDLTTHKMLAQTIHWNFLSLINQPTFALYCFPAGTLRRMKTLKMVCQISDFPLLVR